MLGLPILSPTVDDSSQQDDADGQITLPLFNPKGPRRRGVAAAAAANKRKNSHLPSAQLPMLTQPGPFNPAAALSMKAVKRTLDLEFVEMAEVAIDDIRPAVPGRPPPPAQLPIMEISQLVERFSLMAAVLCMKFPHKAGELFAYQASIVLCQ